MAYISQYPTLDDAHVKATTKFSTGYWPYYATDSTKSLIGNFVDNSWLKENAVSSSRFHIDLSSTKVIKRIYYENNHNLGDAGTSAKDFTFWASNNSASFAELTYATDTGWIPLTISQSYFDQHVASDQADPKYIIVTNTTAYQYYACKIVNSYSYNYWGLRRIELQIEESPFERTFTETITPSDILTKQVSYKKTFSETITASDGYTNLSTLIRNFLETVTLADVLGESAGRWENLTDAMTLTDVLELVSGKGRFYLDDITLSDTLSFVQTLKKNFSETMTLSDTLMKGITKDFSDAMTLADLVALVHGISKDFTEAIALSDILQKAISMYGLSDTMTLTDLLTRIIGKNFNDSITMSDSFSRSAGLSMTLSDSISLVENPFTMTERGETVVDISKDPQVAAGEKHGELLTIHHITNLPKLQITHGRGISLMGGGNYIMGSGDTLTLVYQTDNSIWQECNRGKYL